MRAQLEQGDEYLYGQDQSTVDDLLKQRVSDTNADKFHTERERYAKELSWFNENLKKKVV